MVDHVTSRGPITQMKVELAASAWQLDEMTYMVSVPLLGPCGGDCSLELEVRGGSLHMRHTGRQGYVTELVVELPEEIDREQPACRVVHEDPVRVSVPHRLCGRYWDAVSAMCYSADDGDDVTWNAGWAALQRTMLEMGAKAVRERAAALTAVTPLPPDVTWAITERAHIAQPGWTRGGAPYILRFVHGVMDREHPPAGALRRLEQVLVDGGLTREEVVKACKGGVTRQMPCHGAGWVENEVTGLAVHEAVVRCTVGVTADELLAGPFVENICFWMYVGNDELRAAAKARMFGGPPRAPYPNFPPDATLKPGRAGTAIVRAPVM